MAGSLNSTSAAAAWLLGFAMLLLSLGCGEPADIELALVPNSEINDPISVLEQIERGRQIIENAGSAVAYDEQARRSAESQKAEEAGR